MSDLGDSNLPSYPTFPATTSSDSAFTSEHDCSRTSPLVPTPGNSMENPEGLVVPQDRIDNSSNVMNSSLASNNSLSYYGLSSPMQSDTVVRPTPYTQPAATVGASSNFNTQTPSVESRASATYQAPGNGFSLLGQTGTSSAAMESPGVWGSTSVSQVTGNPFSSVELNIRPELWQPARQQQKESHFSSHLSASRLATTESVAVGDGICNVGGTGLGGSGGSDGTVAFRIQALEQLCDQLNKERGEMEEMFGRQRKTFMNQMSLTEKQLTTCKARIDSYEKEVHSLKEEIADMEKQLTDSAIRAAGIRESFDADRVKYEEEIASLKAIVTGKVPEGLGLNMKLGLGRKRKVGGWTGKCMFFEGFLVILVMVMH